MAPPLKKPLLLLLAGASICMGLIGCQSTPTFYDETTPPTPPPITPPPLKAIEAPLSSEVLDDTRPLDTQPTSNSELETNLSFNDQASTNKNTATGPLSSPISSLPKQSVVPSQNTGSTLKKR